MVYKNQDNEKMIADQLSIKEYIRVVINKGCDWWITEKNPLYR